MKLLLSVTPSFQATATQQLQPLRDMLHEILHSVTVPLVKHFLSSDSEITKGLFASLLY